MNTDVLIVGSGCSGLYCALKLPRDIRITLITKSDLESNDSFLAQGGMCMLKEQSDFDSFFEDTLKAGHYENDKESVGIMINSSPEVVKDLVSYGADFARNDDGSLAYTREGAHSHNRIIFHEDVTGKEITSTLLAQVKKLSNVTLMEYTTMVDIIERDNKCYGAIIRKQDGTLEKVIAAYTVMACGGVGGLYRFSTNFRHLTGDSLAIAKKQRPQQVIGNIGAFLHGGVAELGYVLGRAWWNKGYMSEALAAVVEYLFTCTPVHSIAAWYEWANPASGAVLKKQGFVYEKEIFDKRKVDSPPQDTVPCAYCRLTKACWAARTGRAASQREE